MPIKKPPSTKQPSPLSRIGLTTPAALVLHLPIRYEDETQLEDISTAVAKGLFSAIQTQGSVISSQVVFRPRRQLLVRIADDNGELNLRFINFYPSQQKQMSVGVHLRVRGEIKLGYSGPEMIHPTVIVIAPDSPLPQQLTPIYSTISGLGQGTLRKAIGKGLKEPEIVNFLMEIFPKEVLLHAKYPMLKNLPSLDSAIRILHNPTADVDKNALLDRTHMAWRRVQLEELLAQQISLQRAHSERQKRLAPQIEIKSSGVIDQFLKNLPFELTQAQRRVCQEISVDLRQKFPMNRLLQGDVGSGKTVVAALAAIAAIESGYQVALMAPTEILAEQHFQKFSPWFNELGIEITWLTGSLKAKEKRLAQQHISSGKAKIAIGTHALIQEAVLFKNLGLAIIDEQHRFGVRQRLQLHSQNDGEKTFAHQLMMTATPIPRTLAMTHYADLDMSVIDELPPGRKPILTKLIKKSRRIEVIQGIRSELEKGRQAYWVCPLIEESETLQLQTAVETFENLSQELHEYRVGLVHGRLSAEEKSGTMNDFKSGKLQILVATTVIEVGVDVPNATLMVIEHAERFGYSQLHQLRGRVGRGAEQSLCLLMYSEPLSNAAKERLQTLRETNDGFVIAERDLALRGPGELLGSRQSGDTMLRFVDLQRDTWLIEAAKLIAQNIILRYPDLAQAHLQRWLGSREELIKA